MLIGANGATRARGKAADLLGGKLSLGGALPGAETTPGTVVLPNGELRPPPHPVGHPDARGQNVIGNGVVVDPAVLLSGTGRPRRAGVDTSNLPCLRTHTC